MANRLGHGDSGPGATGRAHQSDEDSDRTRPARASSSSGTRSSAARGCGSRRARSVRAFVRAACTRIRLRSRRNGERPRKSNLRYLPYPPGCGESLTHQEGSRRFVSWIFCEVNPRNLAVKGPPCPLSVSVARCQTVSFCTATTPTCSPKRGFLIWFSVYPLSSTSFGSSEVDGRGVLALWLDDAGRVGVVRRGVQSRPNLPAAARRRRRRGRRRRRPRGARRFGSWPGTHGRLGEGFALCSRGRGRSRTGTPAALALNVAATVTELAFDPEAVRAVPCKGLGERHTTRSACVGLAVAGKAATRSCSGSGATSSSRKPASLGADSRAAPRDGRAREAPASGAAAPGGSGGLPADVDELVALLGRPSRAGRRRGRGGRCGGACRRRRHGGLEPARNRRHRPRRRAGRTTGQACPQARRTAGRCPGRRHPREPVHAAARRYGGHPALRNSTLPAKPRWLPRHLRRRQPARARPASSRRRRRRRSQTFSQPC